MPSKTRVRNIIHTIQFGIFSKRLSLPSPDAEIVSGYEEDVSSIRDGFSAWVKSDPETILKRHLVDAKGANPAFREAPTRKHSPSNEEYRFDADVHNPLSATSSHCRKQLNTLITSTVYTIPPIQHNSMKNGYDENKGYDKSYENKCATNYSIITNNNWNNEHNKQLTMHNKYTNDDVDLDDCVVHIMH